MTSQIYKLRIFCVLSIIILVALSERVPVHGKSLEARTVDYQRIKKDIQIFESIVNTKLSQQFPNPLALVERAKGFYIKGYGVTFTFLVNINRTHILTPFGRTKVGRPETQEQKKKRVEEIKEMLIKTMSDHAGAIDQLAPDDYICIVAHFEDNNELAEVNKNKTIIMRVRKKGLNDYIVKRDYQEFKRRTEIIEY